MYLLMVSLLYIGVGAAAKGRAFLLYGSQTERKSMERPVPAPAAEAALDRGAKLSGYSCKKMDLTGQRFGKLLVLSPADNVGNKTAWHCRCDCGREIVAKTAHLRSGHVKTCGCVAIRERLTLVEGTCVEMLQAKTVRRNNTSGVPGVEWMKGARRWRATICFQGKRRYLGKYVRFEDAVKARKEAEAQFHDAFVERYSKERI